MKRTKPEQKKYNNLLLISGTGRKTGKTSFACQLIRENVSLNIIAIKISCHFHLQQDVSPFLEKQNKFQIYIEKNAVIPRDSSRMVAAGANKVFYIQTEREFAFDAFREMLSLIPKNAPIICESGGLGKYLSPGMHIVMKRPKPLPEDKIITYQPVYFNQMEGNGFVVPPHFFRFMSGKWAYHQLEQKVANAHLFDKDIISRRATSS